MAFDAGIHGPLPTVLRTAVRHCRKENLPVLFKVIPLDEAKKLSAIGLFGEKYGDSVKLYFIGDENNAYSIEYCGGPHVNSTSEIGSFKIIKEEGLGRGLRRIYSVVE